MDNLAQEENAQFIKNEENGESIDLGDVGNTMDDDSSSENEVIKRKRRKKFTKRKACLSTSQLLDENSENETEFVRKSIGQNQNNMIAENSTFQRDQQDTLYQNLEGHPNHQNYLLNVMLSSSENGDTCKYN